MATRISKQHFVALPTPESRFVNEDTRDARSSAQRDRDRILYSGAFARLAEITQVVSPERGYVFHNRLTHSLKVGQIARRIAEYLNREYPHEIVKLGLIDCDAAESAGLAHDLGHPPFGHIAEYELDTLVREAGVAEGFEGNAQSFRIVTRLAISDARDAQALPIRGLNLTLRTLNGVLKYPWAYGTPKRKKWGYYSTERDIFAWVRKNMPKYQRSIIAEIMDWADDITFAIHDLLDFYVAGRIPIDRCKGKTSYERERLISGMFKRKPEWLSEKAKYVEALTTIIEEFPFEPDERYADSFADRARLYAFATGLITYFASALKLNVQPRAASLVSIEPDARREVEVLKQFIWEYVIENPDLAVPQHGQRLAVKTVFKELLNASGKDTFYLFPAHYHEAIDKAKTKASRVRLVADCISGMTEKELMHFYRRSQGQT